MKMGKKLPNRQKRKFEHQIYAYYEGEQEYEYFKHISELINSQPSNKIKRKLKIIPKNCGGGDPRTPVLTAIKTCSLIKIPMVIFDNDNKENQFEEALDLATKSKFDIGYSNINFDYFLALHKLNENKIVFTEYTKNNCYVDLVKKCYNLKDDDDIKSSNTIKKIISQITLEDVFKAVHNCEVIDKRNKQTPYKSVRTPNANVYFKNPDIQIYKVVKKILSQTLII